MSGNLKIKSCLVADMTTALLPGKVGLRKGRYKSVGSTNENVLHNADKTKNKFFHVAVKWE